MALRLKTLRHWDVSAVTSFEFMFDKAGAGSFTDNSAHLYAPDLRGWRPTAVTAGFRGMFDAAEFRDTLDISGWTLPAGGSSFGEIFGNFRSVCGIDMAGWNTYVGLPPN